MEQDIRDMTSSAEEGLPLAIPCQSGWWISARFEDAVLLWTSWATTGCALGNRAVRHAWALQGYTDDA